MSWTAGELRQCLPVTLLMQVCELVIMLVMRIRMTPVKRPICKTPGVLSLSVVAQACCADYLCCMSNRHHSTPRIQKYRWKYTQNCLEQC